MTDSDLAAALGFALFATNAENQSLLVDRAQRVPANSTVDLTDHPDIAEFLEQSRTAYALPNLPHIRTFLDLGDQAYTDVLVNGVDPEQAAADITATMNLATEFDSDSSSFGAGIQPAVPAATREAPPVPTSAVPVPEEDQE